jgi:hypothetical protein
MKRKSNDKRTFMIALRMTATEVQVLRYISETTGNNVSEVIRQAIIAQSAPEQAIQAIKLQSCNG